MPLDGVIVSTVRPLNGRFLRWRVTKVGNLQKKSGKQIGSKCLPVCTSFPVLVSLTKVSAEIHDCWKTLLDTVHVQ